MVEGENNMTRGKTHPGNTTKHRTQVSLWRRRQRKGQLFECIGTRISEKFGN